MPSCRSPRFPCRCKWWCHLRGLIPWGRLHHNSQSPPQPVCLYMHRQLHLAPFPSHFAARSKGLGCNSWHQSLLYREHIEALTACVAGCGYNKRIKTCAAYCSCAVLALRVYGQAWAWCRWRCLPADRHFSILQLAHVEQSERLASHAARMSVKQSLLQPCT